MKTNVHFSAARMAGALLLALGAATAEAGSLLVNGGFENGLAGWTTDNLAGSEGTFQLQSGTTSPVNGDPVPTPSGGSWAAMSDGLGPGSHVLYQDFTVPIPPSEAVLRFDLFVGNRSQDFFTPNPASLDFSINGFNQQVRVDILAAGSDPFSVAAGDVLLNLLQSASGNPLVSGYTPYASDLTALFAAHPGETLRLRFAETDNFGPLQLGVDQVSLSVPEPGSILLLTIGLWGMRFASARRRNSP